MEFFRYPARHPVHARHALVFNIISLLTFLTAAVVLPSSRAG